LVHGCQDVLVGFSRNSAMINLTIAPMIAKAVTDPAAEKYGRFRGAIRRG